MRRYLGEFLSDRRVIDYPALEVAAAAADWSSSAGARSPPAPTTARSGTREADESPLRVITREQTAAVAARLAERHGDRVVVDFAMRYGNPSTASVIARLHGGGLRAARSSSRSTRSIPPPPPPPPTTRPSAR